MSIRESVYNLCNNKKVPIIWSAVNNCEFNNGRQFGFICKNIPIHIDVLHYLEVCDIISLATTCKELHVAYHILLNWERNMLRKISWSEKEYIKMRKISILFKLFGSSYEKYVELQKSNNDYVYCLSKRLSTSDDISDLVNNCSNFERLSGGCDSINYEDDPCFCRFYFMNHKNTSTFLKYFNEKNKYKDSSIINKSSNKCNYKW